MKSAHLGECDDAPNRSSLDTPRLGSILRKGQMGSRTIVVAGISRDDPADLPLVEKDDVVEGTFSLGFGATEHEALCLARQRCRSRSGLS